VTSSASSTTLPGLTVAEVEDRRRRDGFNELPTGSGPHPGRLLLAQLTHLLAVLLWVAAGLALLAGMPQLAAAIVVIVLLNGFFAFWQEYRADRSTQRLGALLPCRLRVARDGAVTTVDARELVTGDVVLLDAGDRVAADMRVVDGRGLRLDESLTTGESAPVAHDPGDALMAGTFVIEGEATAVVTATGARTTLAGIAQLVTTAQRPPSPLTVELHRVVRVVAVVAALTGLLLGAAALALGLGLTHAFLFGVGVAVALVPEGLLPTVTLSLARGAQTMAARKALVRRLDAVETLGATTFICTDKTGTITQNRMSVVEVVTQDGPVHVTGLGYAPVASFTETAATPRLAAVAEAALSCVTGRVRRRGDDWVADGDPMEAAIHCLALRAGVIHSHGTEVAGVRRPFSPDRMVSSCLSGGRASVLGAPEQVLARCTGDTASARRDVQRLADQGRRVRAVAVRDWPHEASEQMEDGLHLLGLLALEDPPHAEVAPALASCRTAGVRVAMITGDHPATAAAIARQVGLVGPRGVVLTGSSLPADDEELAHRLDCPGGVVVARATPADKLRIARVLKGAGHVVAMTGDGVNDAPALREADVGVAMGAHGSDVARESSDLVLLDDNFATIVTAIQLGRATLQNVRRFLTFHLTDNVAELAPFGMWALSGGSFPLAIGVLQVLALDIGTDMLPALALGTEPPREGIMSGRHDHTVVNRAVLGRAFGVLGATEAVASLAAFTTVLLQSGWSWGETPGPALLARASGTAFATIAVCQMANSVACRSTRLTFWRIDPRTNPGVAAAIAAEIALLVLFLRVPALADLLGGSWPSVGGWALALGGGLLLLLVDSLVKTRARWVSAPPRAAAGRGAPRQAARPARSPRRRPRA
jgi:magnesium-transporting ATPase (P-type)